MILPLDAAREKPDRSLPGAAARPGAGSWSTFRRVTLPLSAPGLVAGTVLVFIPSLGQFVVPASLLLTTGPAGVQLVPRAAWTAARSLRVIVDLNAVPPLGIEGVDVTDSGTDRNGVKAFGALGVGNFKMKVHKRCIAKLFERNDLVLDAESIGEVARELMQSTPAPPSVPPPG
jgi:hypothetical protein